MRILVNEIDDQVWTEAIVTLAFAGRCFGTTESVGSVEIRSGGEALQQGMHGAFGYGDITAPCKGEHPQCVVKAHFGGDVPCDDADSLYIEFRRIEREEYRQDIVCARIGIDDDFLRR